MRFKISPVLNIQILSKECTLMNEVRKLVEGLYLDNPRKIQESLKALLEAPPAEGEDYIIVAIKEAIDGGYLSPCGKTAAIISGIISEATLHRDILAAVAEGINDQVVCQDPNWLNDIIFEESICIAGFEPRRTVFFLKNALELLSLTLLRDKLL